MRMENPLFWLQNYCEEFAAYKGRVPHIVINTIDNPGWRVKIEITEISLNNFKEIKTDRSEEDWLYAKVEGNRFDGACGATNLEELISVIKSANPLKLIQDDFASETLKNPLHWLMGWYLFNCNGDWEHSHGIRMNVEADGFWNFEIDLDETILESVAFEKRHVELSKDLVYEVWLEENRFKGKGTIGTLENMLYIFRMFTDKHIGERHRR